MTQTKDKAVQGGEQNPSPLAHSAAMAQSEGTFPTIETLRKRADYLHAASARRVGGPSFLLQARARGDGTALIRVGFTASKKIGNAVLRNRAKRRMRALMRALVPLHGQVGWDYVLVAKPEATVTRNFADMLADLARAFAHVHRTAPPAQPTAPEGPAP